MLLGIRLMSLFVCVHIRFIYMLYLSRTCGAAFFAPQTHGAATCGILSSAACFAVRHVQMPIGKKAKSYQRPANGGGSFAVRLRSYLVEKH